MKIYSYRRYRLTAGGKSTEYRDIDSLSQYLHGDNNTAKDALYDALELHGRVTYYGMAISIIQE